MYSNASRKMSATCCTVFAGCSQSSISHGCRNSSQVLLLIDHSCTTTSLSLSPNCHASDVMSILVRGPHGIVARCFPRPMDDGDVYDRDGRQWLFCSASMLKVTLAQARLLCLLIIRNTPADILSPAIPRFDFCMADARAMLPYCCS